MSSRLSSFRRAISRLVTVSVVVIVIIVVAVGAYVATRPPLATTSSTSSVTSTTSSSTSFTSSSTSTSSSSSTGSQTSPTTLVMDDFEWPTDDLNQLYAVFELPFPNWLEYDVYQPLITLNATAQFNTGTMQFLPVLAENWTVSPDSTTYTFNLRQGVTFSNGDQFNAYQVWMEMYGFYYLSGNSSSWLESYSLFNMSNVHFGPGTIALINQSGLIHPSTQALAIMQNSSWPIYANGPYQIVFHMQAPFLYLLHTLVTYEGLIFDSQWLLQNGGFGTPVSFNSYFNQHPIPGTGPYTVTQVSENNYVKFAQDPTYWGSNLTSSQITANPYVDPGHVKNVIIYYKSDDLTRYTDLSSGVAQMSIILNPNWNIITSNPNVYAYQTMPSWGAQIVAMAMNTQIYPTNITLVRQAIVHAINYSDVAQKAYFGQVHPFVGPEYPAWSQYYNLGNYTPYQYNLTLARQDLAAANISTMPTLTYRIFSGCTSCDDAAQVVQADLAQIGITVNIEALSYSTYSSVYGTYSQELANAQQLGQLAEVGISAWGPATLSPADYWLTFVSNQSSYGNWAIYSNPTVVKAALAFTQSSNVTYIQSLVRAAQAQVYNDAPYAWFGVTGLWSVSGSPVWKTSVVKSALFDPTWAGQNMLPMFNTVTFVGSS